MAASPERPGRDVAPAAVPAGISAATATVTTVSVTTHPLRTFSQLAKLLSIYCLCAQ
jgi:hypothetical protein